MGFFHTYLLRHLHLEAKNSLAAELLFGADPKADIYDRALWLARLLRWIKSDGAELQTTRLRYLFKLAENNPAEYAVVGATIRSIFRDCSALNLFLETGFAHDSGLWTEIGERLLSRLLPRLAENDLLEIISYSGWDEADA